MLDVCVFAGYLQAPWASHQEVEDLVVKTSQRLGLSPYMQQLTRKSCCHNFPKLLHALLQSCTLQQASHCHHKRCGGLVKLYCPNLQSSQATHALLARHCIKTQLTATAPSYGLHDVTPADHLCWLQIIFQWALSAGSQSHASS